MAKYFVCEGKSVLRQGKHLRAGDILDSESVSSSTMEEFLRTGVVRKYVGGLSDDDVIDARNKEAEEAAVLSKGKSKSKSKSKDKDAPRTPWMHSPESLATLSLEQMQNMIASVAAEHGESEYPVPATREDAQAILSADYEG